MTKRLKPLGGGIGKGRGEGDGEKGEGEERVREGGGKAEIWLTYCECL